MYVTPNFKTKKQFKEAVARGDDVRLFQPNDMFGRNEELKQTSGRVTVGGPHYPEPHRWYAQVEHDRGRVTKVIG